MIFPFRHLVILCGAIVMVSVASAQTNTSPSGMTAMEIVGQANGFFVEGKHAEAASLFEKFEADFGKSSEATDTLRSMRFRHAMAYVHLKKFPEAIERITLALALQPPLGIAENQELQFWLGVAQVQEQAYPEARAALEKFLTLFPPTAQNNPTYAQQYPAALRIPEAQLLIGKAWILEEQFREAADTFAKLEASLRNENRGRAVVLHLYALLQAGDEAAALALVAREYPRMDELTQLIAFQTFTLQLGEQLLDKGLLRDAIVCLQRVWPAERLVKHQAARLSSLQGRLQAANANPRADAYEKLLLSQLIIVVQRELDTFRQTTSFDASLRLRLATAYQSMMRYRESALILEDMLEQMPADAIVEKASVNLVQTWYQMQRWPKVTLAAQAFAKKFPESESLPLVSYLAGVAEQKELHYAAAGEIFDNVLQKYPKSEFAPRAAYAKAFTLLLADENVQAIEAFADFTKAYPEHELTEASVYWQGMGYSLDKQFEEARSHLQAYLSKYPQGEFAGLATFRRAYCAQQAEDYTTSMRELMAYMRAFPGHESASEARVLLGDALMNEGRMEEGIAAFAGIPREDTRFYEEGVFRVGKALKLMEEQQRLLDHMRDFQQKNPRSPRVAEAINSIGWVYRQQDQPEKAREVFWAAIREHGNDPTIRSVEELFPSLARLYRGEDQLQYLAGLRDLYQGAMGKNEKTLALRALWAQGAALRRSDPQKAQALLIEAVPMADVSSANPLLLADLAEALATSGDSKRSIQMFRDLIKWNPRAPQKDRALVALGFAELQAGNEKGALEYFTTFEKQTPSSREIGRVLLAKGTLLEARGQRVQARDAFEALLASEYATGNQKAEALYRIGESQLRDDKPALAIPYFQRIYVMYGRWRDWVAKAYLSSGEAFEKLNDKTSARNTYTEMLALDDLAAFEEARAARVRLEALGKPPEGANQG